MLASLEYKATDFSKFGSLINETKSEPTLPSGFKRARFFIGGGIRNNGFKINSSQAKLNSLKFKNTTSFSATAGADILSPRGLQNLFIRLEVSMNTFNAKGQGESFDFPDMVSNDYTLKQVNITPTVSLLYNVVKTNGAKIYIGVGAGFNISSYPEQRLVTKNKQNSTTKTEENSIDVEKGWVAEYARVGVFLGTKIELGFLWQFGGSFINYVATNEESNPLFLRVAYQF